MNKTFTAAFLYLFPLLLTAQSIDTNWVRQYDRTGNASNVYAALLPDDSYVIAMRNIYYQINGDGDSLLKYDGLQTFGSVSALLGVEDGFLVGAAFNNAPAIALRGLDMDTVWTKSLGSSWGQVSAFLSDGDDFYGSG